MERGGTDRARRARGSARTLVPFLLALAVIGALVLIRCSNRAPDGETSGAPADGEPASSPPPAGGESRPPQAGVESSTRPPREEGPWAEIAWPSDGSAHRTVRLDVRGEARGLDALYVNSDRVPVAADGTWAVDLELAAGEAEIRVSAPPVDGAAPRELDLARVTIDLEAPLLRLSELPGGAHPTRPNVRVVGARAALAGTLDDPWPGGVRELALDGAAVPFERVGFRVPLALEQDGEHTAELVARDAAGNEARLRVALVRDTRPPEVAILERVDAPGGVLLLRGEVRDLHPLQLFADGRAITIDRDGRFEHEIERDSVDVLRLVAEDAAGNRSAELVVEL